MADDPVAKEQLLSRTFKSTADGLDVTTNWFIFNTRDPLVALDLLPKVGDAFDSDGTLLATFVDDVVVSPTENQKPFTQTAVVHYKNPNSGGGGSRQTTPTANVATWSMSITSETVNKKKAISQSNFPVTPVEFLSINKKSDGTVEGIDLLSPVSNLKIVHWLPKDVADSSYMDILSGQIANHVNSDKFAGPWGNWLKHEVLYMGAEVSKADRNLIELTHTFQRSVNGTVKIQALENNVVSEITVRKEGWEYLWEQFKDIPNPEDITKGTVKGAVVSSHLATVYEEANFASINLPREFVGGTD